MSKTIAQIAGRMKFTENEIAMTKGIAEAAYDLNLEFACKDKVKLSKKQKQSMKESMFKIVSKTVWDYKHEFYQHREISKVEFKELANLILTSLFVK